MVPFNWVLKVVVSAACVGFVAHAQPVLPSAQKASVQGESPRDPLTNAAALYATYHGAASAVQTRGFSSATDIDDSLRNLGGHNPQQLTAGWLAYSALIASQNELYRVSVRDTESFYGREVFTTGLANDLGYARTLNGGNAAVLASLSALEIDQRRLVNAATFVKEQAYALQGSSWAMRRVRNSSATADNLTASTRTGLPAHPELREAFASQNLEPLLAEAGKSGVSSVWDTISNAAAAVRIPDGMPVFSQRTGITHNQEAIANRIATLAAYRIIGADTGSMIPMQRAMSDRTASGCVTMANLNLQQCVAAAHKHYEVPFCIGQHDLADIGQCFGQPPR